MKRFCTFTAFTLLLLVATILPVLSQSASKAVMEVRVEVINGSSIERNDSSAVFELINDKTSYGEFTISLTDGTEFIASSTDIVMLESDHTNLEMNCRLVVLERSKNAYSFNFTAYGYGEAEHGIYKGVQIATIEYL
jgi:hypothetical protein